MKYILSNYNNDLSWLKKYTEDYIIYNQGENINDTKAIQVPHRGSDICDKFSFIIDNYNSLPDVACYCKGNLFKFITPEEFDIVKDNTLFTPLLTQNHKTYLPICWYEDKLYCESNDYWYLNGKVSMQSARIMKIFEMYKRTYNKFAPGSNYILTKDNILKHPKSLYEELKSLIDWAEYPVEAQLMERNLYYLWK